MSGSFLVDTNVLVYAYDRSESEKQRKAGLVLEWLASEGFGVLSTQVLAEFFWAVTRKLPSPLTLREGYIGLERYVRSWKVLSVTPHIVLEAGRGCVEYQLAFWDAQIWATAKLNQIPTILSEDFRHKARIEGVEFLDPFIADFPL